MWSPNYIKSQSITDRCTYVDKFVKITLSQVMENRGIIKISQVRHIFSFFVFGRVDLLKDVLLKILGLLFFSSSWRRGGGIWENCFFFLEKGNDFFFHRNFFSFETQVMKILQDIVFIYVCVCVRVSREMFFHKISMLFLDWNEIFAFSSRVNTKIEICVFVYVSYTRWYFFIERLMGRGGEKERERERKILISNVLLVTLT